MKVYIRFVPKAKPHLKLLFSSFAKYNALFNQNQVFLDEFSPSIRLKINQTLPDQIKNRHVFILQKIKNVEKDGKAQGLVYLWMGLLQQLHTKVQRIDFVELFDRHHKFVNIPGSLYR